MTRKVITVSVALTIVLSLVGTALSNTVGWQFRDVPDDHPRLGDIHYVWDGHLMDSDNNAFFNPGQKITPEDMGIIIEEAFTGKGLTLDQGLTRAEFAAVLAAGDKALFGERGTHERPIPMKTAEHIGEGWYATVYKTTQSKNWYQVYVKFAYFGEGEGRLFDINNWLTDRNETDSYSFSYSGGGLREETYRWLKTHMDDYDWMAETLIYGETVTGWMPYSTIPLSSTDSGALSLLLVAGDSTRAVVFSLL